jgi:long-subunit acyl-CoA synthetase (AMP-forming)
MAFVSMDEILETPGEGYLVGRPIPELDLKLEHGEVIVRGPHVVRRYLDNEQANRETKIPDPDGSIWHRTGDEGRIDGKGRLWILGRIKDRVLNSGREHSCYALEQAIEALPGVGRAAVINGARGPRIFFEGLKASEETVRDGLDGNWKSAEIRKIEALPVDGRHFWKVDRERLREL